ncbi:NUDIX domain-containing protein [Paenactinomyces guangxiensis]|uniref:UDP-N-acetylglucosamine 1-carboxyvinyltransferase n=1 Tax=Paenactinomyces guangxiensis TaxID=1490290 RepID=A0A7W1WUU8_9BACL|nr:NUDIX domain-containing protein [Paenactinomyces guangxiensis]MBA4496432.1 NUDIX domain-containing protein [Paenactinomyces guangxiensis]MBH8593533.1 NUDIX domain-containing protein [Paenactinomyces guangxiensis]
MHVNCAGMILFSIPDKKVLLVQHKEGHWGFPKGQIEQGETELQAACRELQEETGAFWNGILNPKRVKLSEEYLVHTVKGLRKSVVYFVAFTCDMKLNWQPGEIVNARWLSLNQINQLRSFYSKKLLAPLDKILQSEVIIRVDEQVDLEMPLSSSARIQGSKHAYSRIAPLLFIYKSLKINNIPRTIDSYAIHQLIRLSFQNHGQLLMIPPHLSNLSRSIMSCIPALLFIHPKVRFYQPKGCQIGERKIDLYLQVICRFGVQLKLYDDGMVELERGVLEPTAIKLPFPSFTGSSTAIILTSMVKGNSYIENISIEPEIIELIEVLRLLGLDVTFFTERNIVIKNRWKPKLVNWTLSEDRNVLVTRLMMALISGREFKYTSQRPLYLTPLMDVLERMGVRFSYSPYSIHLFPDQLEHLKPVHITCDHFPGFCSDWQPLIAPVLSKINGTSVVQDRIFENRYRYIEQINRINPNFIYEVRSDELRIKGIKGNHGDAMDAESIDLRSAAANIIALVGENNSSKIKGLFQLLRGYEDMLSDLRSVGGFHVTFDVAGS